MNTIIPNFEDMQVVDKDGNWTPVWKNIMSTLITFLQKNHSSEGLIAPEQTSANILLLNNIKSKAALIYNSDTNKLNVNINGTFKEVITT